MTRRAKRQRLSVDGAEAVTAVIEPETTAETTQIETTSKQTEEKMHQENLKHRRSLFVRSLAPTVTSDELTELFSQSYPIKHAVAVVDRETQKCKGYGFVTFADAEDAQRAIEEFNGHEVQGRKIKVEIAEPRHRDVDDETPGHKKSVPAPAALEAKAAREKKREMQPPPKLIVRNLPWSIKTPDDLGALFRSYGKVKHATLPQKKPGTLAGFGFVLLRGRKNAEKALEGVNGKVVDGRTLAVDWAVEKDAYLQAQAQEETEEDKEEGNEDTEMLDEEADEDSEQDSEEDVDGEGSEDDSDIESVTDYDNLSDVEDSKMDVDSEEKKQTNNSTLFIRNLPFSATDESLEEHFEQFGPVRYARIVIDHATERPKGTGFVCFVKESDAIECLKGIPKIKQVQTTHKKEAGTVTVTHSVLENEDADPTGRYTMEGRVLSISLAVSKDESLRLTAEGAANRFSRDKDKRRLYLLAEGTIASNSPLYQKLSPSEITMREASAKQRQNLIKNNPALHLSLTRLAVRNIPRSVTSKDLKELARQAVVGFAKDVKEGKRQKLSKEELVRGGQEMIAAEQERKRKGKGIVKQAKVVYETEQGKKVDEATGAGRSRGYGFIEYYTHRNALMGLRWLNGHAVDYNVIAEKGKGKKAQLEAVQDRKKRLIVEFAIENASVVARRNERGQRFVEKGKEGDEKLEDAKDGKASNGDSKHQKQKNGKEVKNGKAVKDGSKDSKFAAPRGSRGGVGGKRKREALEAKERDANGEDVKEGRGGKDEKLAARSRIIMKKRMARRAKRKGGA